MEYKLDIKTTETVDDEDVLVLFLMQNLIAAIL